MRADIRPSAGRGRARVQTSVKMQSGDLAALSLSRARATENRWFIYELADVRRGAAAVPCDAVRHRGDNFPDPARRRPAAARQASAAAVNRLCRREGAPTAPSPPPETFDMGRNTHTHTKVVHGLGWVGLGSVQIFPLVVGWIGLDHTKWTHGQL